MPRPLPRPGSARCSARRSARCSARCSARARSSARPKRDEAVRSNFQHCPATRQEIEKAVWEGPLW
eukprot:12866558-Alexandrium_andersonii.AAC.1